MHGPPERMMHYDVGSSCKNVTSESYKEMFPGFIPFLSRYTTGLQGPNTALIQEKFSNKCVPLSRNGNPPGHQSVSKQSKARGFFYCLFFSTFKPLTICIHFFCFHCGPSVDKLKQTDLFFSFVTISKVSFAQPIS